MSQGHAIVLSEIKCFNTSGEIVDALGFKSQISTLVECKASRADFLVDKNKHFRKESHKGVGQQRYYLCEPDIIKPEDLPAKCGKLFITKEHAFNHANEEHPNWEKPEMQKRKGWITPYGFADFTEPVTYKQACEDTEEIAKDLFKTKRT